METGKIIVLEVSFSTTILKILEPDCGEKKGSKRIPSGNLGLFSKKIEVSGVIGRAYPMGAVPLALYNACRKWR